MRTASLRVLAALLTVALAGAVDAHLGDTIFPIWEIPTSDLPDLHDGTLEDWEEALPMASLNHNDFVYTANWESVVDAEDFAFRVFLAWHSASQQFYMGIESIDDVYLAYGNGFTQFMVDGDHSGGQDYSQAQRYLARPEATGDQRLLDFAAWFPLDDWATEPPWADVGAYQYGESPNISAIELSVTAWDDLDWHGPELSKRSVLKAGRIVGFNIAVMDFDVPDSPDGGRTPDGIYLLAEIGDFGDYLTQGGSADNFVDGELIPCFRGDCSGATTAVSQDSWGRIKASFR